MTDEKEEIKPRKEVVIANSKVKELYSKVSTADFSTNYSRVQSKKEIDELEKVQSERSKAIAREVGQSLGKVADALIAKSMPGEAATTAQVKVINEVLGQADSGKISEAMATEKLGGIDVGRARNLIAKRGEVMAKIEQDRARIQESAKANVESQFTERLSQAQQKVDKALAEKAKEVEALVEEIAENPNNQQLIQALEAWGQCPSVDNSKDIGPDNKGYNAGVEHYFAGRAAKDKADRWKASRTPMTVAGFVEFTHKMTELIENPANNDQIAAAVEIIGDKGRRLIATTVGKSDFQRMRIVAYAPAAQDRLKLVTAYPGQPASVDLVSEAKEDIAKDSARFNQVGKVDPDSIRKVK